MIIDINNICTYYGLFIPFGAGIMMTKIYLDFISLIKVAVIIEDDFDSYGHIVADSHFCKFCYAIVVEKKFLKFRFRNCINISFYHNDPNIFNNLTAIKKAIIACVYPIMSIIKLKPSNSDCFVLYHQI